MLELKSFGHTSGYLAEIDKLFFFLPSTLMFRYVLQSSLAAARADNFYYPPEWDPSQGSLNKFHGQHAERERESARKEMRSGHSDYKIWSFTMKSACCKHVIVIQTDPKNCEYVIISGARKKTEEYDNEDAETMALPADEERGKLVDPFYRLEHQEEDLKKKKEAEPVLVRLQGASNARHTDDHAIDKALRARLRSQKQRVAEEELASKKMGLSIRLLPASDEYTPVAAHTKFHHKFETNEKDKRALIKAGSIFSNSSSGIEKRRLELEAKRRKIKAAEVSSLLAGSYKPSSWTTSATPSRHE
ncbi:putative splicing factor YJU2B [Drosera capensis]